MVIGAKKNICQNPKCCESSTQDRWNKKLEAYESRKAYFKPEHKTCLLYTSPSPRDRTRSRMPSSA